MQQDVVQLDIAVRDAHAVAVVQSDDELLEEPTRLLLRAAVDLSDTTVAQSVCCMTTVLVEERYSQANDDFMAK